MVRCTVIAMVPVVAIGGCTETADPIVCTSGKLAGTSENQDMTPGQPCNACHAYTNSGGDGNEAPIYAFAGTVYTAHHEPDNCVGGTNGGGSAVIEVVSRTGKRFFAPIFESGNFMLESDEVTYPITARITYQGRTRWMIEPQMSGDCNTCHSEAGGSGASGRIRLP